MKSLMQCLALTDTCSVTVKLIAGRKKERNDKLEFPCGRLSIVAVFGIRLTFIMNAGFSRRMNHSLFSFIPIIYFINLSAKSRIFHIFSFYC